ncbi:hypothetical protein KUTeg_006039 [Tegillarca granosa]|uniref:OTU domain-containing protein n=1 Tax=Tegillarca granosa TaxID=220873 RepID=A0ABQ9FFE7_TEGGR|nr:hypothetical protein KUTeg_006039 [Tegillarca granosa]
MSRKTSPKATYAKDETNDLQPLISLIGGINHLTTLAKTLGLTVYDVQPDGNCMYRSVIDQLRIHGVFDLTAGLLRQQAVTYLTENPYHEDGGIAEVTNRKICIISVIGSSHNQTTIQPGTGDADQSESIFLGHINDAHYVSLRPNDWLEKCFEKADKRAGFTEEHEYCRTTSGSHVQSSVPLPSIEVCVDHVTGWPFPHLTFMMAASFKEPYFYNRAKERRDIQEQFSIDTAVTFIEDREQITLVYPQNDYSGNRTLVYISPNIPNFVTFDQNNIGENTNYLAVELTTHPGRLSLQHVRRKESSDHPKSLLGHVKKSSVDEYDIQQFWQSVRLRRLPQTSANDLYCFATEEWPVCAMEWKEYRRLSGWPDSSLVKEIMEAGCLIIPLALTESTFP